MVTTAKHRAIDRIRRDRTLAQKTRLLETPEPETMHDLDDTVIPDERLELIFTCCHPALATEAQVALTLRALGGLTTEQIARAFLVPAETMKRRLSRAKVKIKEAGIPFAVPAEHLLPDRLQAAARERQGNIRERLIPSPAARPSRRVPSRGQNAEPEACGPRPADELELAGRAARQCCDGTIGTSP